MNQKADTISDPLPYIERVKIQAEILLPLYRRLKDEIGPDRARELLSEAVNEFATEFGRSIGRNEGSNSLEKLRKAVRMFTAGDAIEIEPVEESDTVMAFNVRRCRYAELFRKLGDREFGRLMVCGIDPPMTAGIGSDLKLERTQTMMEGADHCDFRWTRDADEA